MGLAELGVGLDGPNGGIRVDAKLRTSVKGIYAAGDCTGDQQFTHYAGFQGAIAARNSQCNPPRVLRTEIRSGLSPPWPTLASMCTRAHAW